MSSIPRLHAGDRLCIATHNAGKLKEFRELFAPFGLELVSAGELRLPEPEETGTTFAENARTKAHAAARGAMIRASASMPWGVIRVSIRPTGPASRAISTAP